MQKQAVMILCCSFSILLSSWLGSLLGSLVLSFDIKGPVLLTPDTGMAVWMYIHQLFMNKMWGFRSLHLSAELHVTLALSRRPALSSWRKSQNHECMWELELWRSIPVSPFTCPIIAQWHHKLNCDVTLCLVFKDDWKRHLAGIMGAGWRTGRSPLVWPHVQPQFTCKIPNPPAP